MKKITLLLALTLMCSFSAFATRYLVQTGVSEAATWRAAGEGELLVDLTVAGKTFNVWYNETVVSGDEIWIAAGTYVLSAVNTIDQANHSVMGGFSGTETTALERQKGTSPWDYTNETILDGNNSVQVLFAGGAFANVLFDGLTITKSSAANAAAQYRDGVTLQNCKIINNNSTGNGAGINFYNGGNVINSYIAGNVASAGGGVYSNNASTTVTSIVSGCLIENNRAYTTAGGIRVQGAGFTNVTDCVIRSNKGLDDAGTVFKPGAAIYTNSSNNNFTNCLIYNNSGTNVIYFNGGNITNSTIVNNVGQVYIASATASITMTNTIVWGNKTSATGETNTGITSNITNKNTIISNSAVYPTLASDAYTQTDNLALELGNDSQDGAKGPGFVLPTTFFGHATTSEQTTELETSDWSIKYTSAALNSGKTISGFTTDLAGLTRAQGSAYDMGAYELAYFNLTVTFNEGGTVNELTSGAVLNEPKGKATAFTITPASGKSVKSVLYNSTEVKADIVEGVYSTPALTANSTLVVEFEDNPSTGIHTEKQSFLCFSNGNSIEVQGLSADEKAELYNVTGARIAVSNATNSNVTFNTGKGIYFVKVSDKVQKVVVR
ncbi:MAG: right-handed parallel beta-helix repeat-containing protein [Paludibacteraceae bacterium]|nr:right-handed parallel beta-helix repeat-containing protein [Paludibacteraceae bacterium]